MAAVAVALRDFRPCRRSTHPESTPDADRDRFILSGGRTTFGADIALPQLHGPLFLRLGIEETLLGKIADQAFKPPQVELVERYADRTIEIYRLIPGMIADGMLISPTIRTIDDYETLARGGDLASLRSPTSIRAETSGPWAILPSIRVSLEALAIPAVASSTLKRRIKPLA